MKTAEPRAIHLRDYAPPPYSIPELRLDFLLDGKATRVKAVMAEIVDFTPSITLTGVIEARTKTDLSFRINGKISERIANVGDHVVTGQVLAKLDPDEQQEELVSAKASVASAEALARQTSVAFDRQRELLGRGS